MHIPNNVKITIAIIVAIGVGTGALVFGIGLLSVNGSRQEFSVIWIAIGAALLASSVSALVAHLAGGFRDIDEH